MGKVKRFCNLLAYWVIINNTRFENLYIGRTLNKGIWQNPLLEGSLLDFATVDPWPQEGLVGTSHSRPRGDDVLNG